MILVALGRFVQFCLLLATLRFATSILAPEEIGKISIVVSTIGFFSLFFLNPVGMFLNRRLLVWNSRGEVKKYLYFFWWYVFTVAILVCVILGLVFKLNIWEPDINYFWFVSLVSLNILFATINQVSIPSLNQLGYRSLFLGLTVATNFFSLVFALVSVYIFSYRAEYWMYGLLLGNLIIGFYAKKIFYEKLNVNDSFSLDYRQTKKIHLHGFFNYIWPIALAVSLGWLQSQSYRYMVEYHLNLEILGLFVAGYGISAGLIGGLDSIFSTFFQPNFYRRISSGNVLDYSDAWISYAKAVFPSLFLTSVFIICLAPDLTRLLLGERYQNVQNYVMWGAIVEMMRMSVGIFALMAHALMKTKLLILPNFVGAFLSVILGWYFIDFWGGNGISISLVLSFSVSAFLSFKVIQEYLNKKFSFTSLFLPIIFSLALFGLSLIIVNILTRLNLNPYILALIHSVIIGIVFIFFLYKILKPVIDAHEIEVTLLGHK
ncbi:RfbX Membrane protein involved in the export of O-antigen and teichoic acid [Candidatus Methylopumilus planktonicus]|uniref:polysaccharide biosynthesis C-terminal domain-containing protein n=1 Tax=Candidatus Methylopumilus planktonicus TaxID=1581557 RepID=UPI003BEED80E